VARPALHSLIAIAGALGAPMGGAVELPVSRGGYSEPPPRPARVPLAPRRQFFAGEGAARCQAMVRSRQGRELRRCRNAVRPGGLGETELICERCAARRGWRYG
jgi:hypothetical protein